MSSSGDRAKVVDDTSGVVVVGMHRTGTSGVARALHLMGLATARRDDLMGAADGNPTGLMESWSLTALNDELLLALGGTWSAPPSLAAGWERGAIGDSFLGRAERAFRQAHPESPWVWKDPRTSLTLPFWRRVVGDVPVVATLRHPADVGRSLESRDDQEPSLAVGLWGRYIRALVDAVTGSATYLVDWDRLQDDPEDTVRSLGEWLGGLGIDVRGSAETGIDPSVPRVRLTAEERDADPSLTSSEREAFELLRSLAGAHERFPAVELPEETPERKWLMEERRRLEVAAILTRGTAAQEVDGLRRYLGRLEAEIRKEVEARATLSAYARHVADELSRSREVYDEAREYAEHLEEEIRRKDGYIEELSRSLRQATQRSEDPP